MKQSAGNNSPVDTAVSTFTDINTPTYCIMQHLHNRIRPGRLRGIGVFFFTVFTEISRGFVSVIVYANNHKY